MRKNLAALTISGIAFSLTAQVAPVLQAAPLPAAVEARNLPLVTLRGFGKVSARFQEFSAPPKSSVLQITCESAEKAQLVHAKYLSDLSLLPGVSEIALSSKITAHEIANQGAVAALRDGAQVLVFSAQNRADLAEFYPRAVAIFRNYASGLGPRVTPLAGRVQKDDPIAPREPDAAHSRPETTVPMWLDRWDKFGFRFYYRPFELPPNVPDNQRKNYDVAHEFEWAQKMNRTGLVFWDDQNRTDTAEGLMNENWWDWAQNAARAKNLPVAVNISTGGGAESPWLLNRYREQTQLKMPQYSGDFYEPAGQGNGGLGTISWNSGEAEDVALGLLQSSVRRFNRDANVVSWLEPHGELKHGAHDIFMEYGPVADATYRSYLTKKYGTPGSLGTRWFGDKQHFKSWNEVRVPEVSSFLGWGPQAVDLTGTWRVGYELNEGNQPIPTADLFDRRKEVKTEAAPAEWFKPDFDDSTWPKLKAPGNDMAVFLPQRPAVYRQTFNFDAARLKGRWWLYVWDLNRAWGQPIQAVLNGVKIGQSNVQHPVPHWDAYEATNALKPGANQISLRLPQGYLAYRVYLSPDAPTQYPNFGIGKNAQWVDLCDWIRASRLDACRRGTEMIRQIDPNRQITFMHPDEYADGIKQLTEEFGGEFHNTGYMGAFYSDLDPLLMQGAGLPFSLEPGGPPSDLAGYKKMMGLYYSEGAQGLDYFIHLGDVLWHDDIRREFEATQPLVHLIGKYHAPPAEVAVLYSTQGSELTGFPWGNDPNVNLPGGYWPWNIAACLRDRYARDGLTEGDFARGHAAKYKVVIDSNTSIMDENLVSQIEKYVRGGGTFVTFAQTGRHTPEAKDAWPISRLTSYKVTRINKYNADGSVPQDEWHKLKLAPNQSIYRANFDVAANGLSLQKSAPDCQDLLLWDDGSVAVGMRPLGKGFIVQVGAKFHANKVFDRIEPGGNNAERKAMTALFEALLQWHKIAPTPAQLTANGAPDGAVILRHWLSNNGLYDVWTLWNQDAKQAATTDLVFDGIKASCLEVVNGQPVPITSDAKSSRLANLHFEPLQTRAFLTTRGNVQNAALDWLDLQRSWWRGTKAPSAKPLPAPPHKLSRDLSADWAFKSLNASDDATILAANAVDKAWTEMNFGVWGISGPEAKHAILRRNFTVPSTWTNGRISLWLQSWFSTTFFDKGRIFLDGKLIHDWSADALSGVEVEALKPGTSHTLALEIQSEGKMTGLRGGCWLSFVPNPQSRLDLSGDWMASREMLRYDTPTHLPGDYQAFAMRRTITIPAQQQGKNAVLSVDGGGPLLGVLINGNWVRRHHHMIGQRWNLNLTPWMKPGADNEIEIICNGNVGQGKINAISLDFYEPGVYP